MEGIDSERIPFRIGNQTSYAAKYPLLPFEYAVANGFDAFEWFPDKKESGAGFSIPDINHRTRRSIKETAHANGIALSVHAPWGADPFTPVGHDHLMEGIFFAQEIGATLFTIHLSAEAGRFIPAIEDVIERTGTMGIGLAIENTPLTSPEDVNEVFSHLRASRARKTSHVGMCLDLGHANLSTSTVNDYLRFLDRLDPAVPIIHVHLHENFGDRDSHLLVFSGPSAQDESGLQDFLDRLRARRFSGSIILEHWADPPSLLNQAREKLLVMADPYRRGGGAAHAQEGDYLFIYGTLKKGSGGRMSGLLLRSADFVDEGTFVGRLFMANGYPGAMASEDPHDRVYGEVYRLKNPDSILPRLDEYEGYTDTSPAQAGYVRKRVDITLRSGKRIRAWIYLLNASPEGLGRIESGRFLGDSGPE